MLNYRKFLLGCVVFTLPMAASAGIFSNPYNHFYVNVGAGGYYVQHPKFEVGTYATGHDNASQNTTSPLAKIDVHQITPQLNLGVGYWFMNCPQNWVSMLFGHEEAFELDLSGFYLKRSNNKSNLGNGNVWRVDGGGSIFFQGKPVELTSLKLNSTFFDLDTGLYFKGKIYTSNPKLYLERAVGIVNSYYYNKYDYSLLYNQGSVVGEDQEVYKVQAYYTGLSIRHELNYQLTKHFTPFALLDVQLLAIHATLNAEQRPNAIGTNNTTRYTANDSVSKFNYRAIAALGMKYQFNSSIYSPVISVKAGVDHWNYVPRVVSPNHEGDKKAHLYGATMNNGFAMLLVEVPFG